MIYFCIAALNEERTVGVVLWKLRQVMTEMQRDFQIIVVDDASTDATQQVLNPYARVLPLTLIRNEKQLGYAASMEIAVREAVRRSPYPKRDALITLQADFTEDPDCVPALVKRVEAGADLVACTPAMDEATPKSIRRARRLFNWLVKSHEWSQLGDPFCGLRAYRVMTIKRAIETRGTARLISWEGWAGNAELLAQTMPHSRRNDTVETTLHYRRLQRPSRFKFVNALKQVMGMRAGKPGRAEPVSLPDTTIVVPAAIAVELAASHVREETRRRHSHTPSHSRGAGRRDEQRPRRDNPRRGRDGQQQPRQRDETRRRPPRPPRAEAAPAELAEAVTPTADAAVPTQEQKKRRRPRRRSKKRTQRPEMGTPGAAPGENGEAAVSVAPTSEGEAHPQPVEGVKKKSRRGRRGGRGRRRGPRPDNAAPNGEEQSNTENAS